MINRKNCPNCNNKINNNSNFCSNCGTQLKNLQKKWGLLGNNNIKQKKAGFMSNMSDKMMDKMLGSAMRLLQKEMTKGIKEIGKSPQPKMRLMINGQEITPEIKKINKKDKNTRLLPIEFSQPNLEKYKSLPKKEPESTLKRIENKIKYELNVPELESIQDISIIRLENSIEIKAIGKNEAYIKTIPIDLNLRKYSLLKGILTLEMDAE